MIMTHTPPQRPRGRPHANHPAARQQILDALVQVLESAPLERPSLRTVAQAAGVTPALLHYHFGDLSGLLRTLHAERVLPLLQPLLQELQAGESGAGAALARFLQKWTAMMLRHRWLAACLLLTPAGSAHPPNAEPAQQGCGGMVRAAVASAQQQGTVRRDLPGDYIALLILSLGLLPHLAQTAVAAGLDGGALADPERAVALMLQHLSILLAGVAR